MLKHVSLSPWRNRSDSVSLASSGGTSSCGSGSPSPGHTPPPSRASSCASLVPLSALSSFSSVDVAAPQQTTIKVYANCLRPDIEYKTLSITYETTCREVVQNLLNKYKMRHRDPRLFYLTMEVTVRRANVRTVIPLDEDTRPAALQSCHPRGDSRFALQTRRGGLVKVYDSALMSGSKYKSLLVSEKTTVDELIQMLLTCYNSNERVEQFSLYEVCEGEEYHRKLHPDDLPLKVTQRWASTDRHLRIRRNPDYNPHMRKSLWASDTSIALAMSRLQLQNPHHHHHHHHHHHPASQKINGNNNSLAYRRSHAHPQTHVNGNDSNNNSTSGNVNKRNSMLTSQDLLNRLIQQQQQHQQQQQQQQQQQSSRIVVPHPSQMSQLQLQQMKSLPSTPLVSKHISTSASSYADYENYLFI